MKKLRITPLNLLTMLAMLFLAYILIVTENTGHLDFRGIALGLVLIPFATDLVFRFLFKDFAKVVLAETILLIATIVGCIVFVYFF